MIQNRKSALVTWGSRLAGMAAALIGIYWLGAWLAGWATAWAVAGAITVKSNMALALVLSGITLLLVSRSSREKGRVPVSALVSIVLILGALTLSEHLFRIDLGIDQLLATEPPGAAATASPNRMGPMGATNLVLLGAGFLFLYWNRRPVAQYLGLAVCVITLVPAVGFLYGAEELYNEAHLTGIAWPTVVAQVLLGMGLILADANRGPMARYLRADAGGAVLRRMVPAVITIPLAFGFFIAYGERQGFFDTRMGIGLLVIGSILVFSLFLWRTASALSREEAAARHAETNLRASQVWFHTLFGTISEGFCTIEVTFDERGKPVDFLFLETNRAFEKQTGLRNAEGKCASELLPKIEPKWVEMCGRVALTGESLQLEDKSKPSDRWYNVTAFRFGQPEERKVAILFNDITERKQAEELLHRNNETFHRLIENNPMGIYVVDADLRLRNVSLGARRAFANVPEPLIGREFTECMHIIWFEPFASETISQFRHTLETGEPHVSNDMIEQRRDTREVAAYDWRIERITLPDGRFGVVCYFYDLSERQRLESELRESEARHAFLVRLGDALRPLANPLAIKEASERVLGEHLRVSRVAYFDVLEGDYVVDCDYVDSVPHIAGRHPMDSFGSRLLNLYRSGQTVVHVNVSDDETLTEDERAAYAALQIHAFVGVPLVKNGEFLAGLAVHMACPRDWTTAEVRLIEATVERTWAAVERAHAERGLHERDERLRLAIQHSHLTAWQCDSTRRFNWVYNPWFGLAEGELLGMTLEELEGNEAMSEFVAQVREVLGKGAGSRRTIRYVPSDGRERYFDQQVEPVCGTGGEPLGIIGTSLDVTERVLAEQRLQKSEEGFRLMIGHSLEPMLLINEAGVIECISKKGADLLGFQETELVGTRLDRFLDWSTKLDLSLRIQDFFKHGPLPAQGVVRIKKKEGDWCWIDVHASFINYGQNTEKYMLKLEPVDMEAKE